MVKIILFLVILNYRELIICAASPNFWMLHKEASLGFRAGYVRFSIHWIDDGSVIIGLAYYALSYVLFRKSYISSHRWGVIHTWLSSIFDVVSFISEKPFGPYLILVTLKGLLLHVFLGILLLLEHFSVLWLLENSQLPHDIFEICPNVWLFYYIKDERWKILVIPLCTMW